MPERKNKKFRRVDSSEVQGEGSFVVFESPNFEAMGAVLKVAQLEGLEDGKVNLSSLDQGMFDAVFELLEATVKEWNWVDDQGDPMPQPVANGTIRKLLTQEEQLFLIGSIQLGDAKN